MFWMALRCRPESIWNGVVEAQLVELVERAVTVPSWTGEQEVSMGVPACNVLAEALTTSVGSEVWACYLSV